MMSQKGSNYTRLSGPKPPKRGNTEASPCRCSITYRQEYIASSFRMVAIAIIMLFGFSVLLFVWNIVLWREVAHLQTHVTTLRQTIEKISLTPLVNCDVTTTTPSDRPRDNWIKPRLEKEEKGGYVNYLKSGPVEHLLRREKRSALEAPADIQLSISHPLNTEVDLLSRIKRSGKKKNSGKRRKVKRPKKDRTSRRRLSKATAIHVPIKGPMPYKGMQVSGSDGIIQHWDTSLTVNQGFNADSNGVVIQEEGVYFIYSQVTFKMGEGVEVHEKILTGSGVADKPELTSCSNPIPSNAFDSYVTCYSSGVKHLQTGDKIQIQVHPSNLLVFANPYYTYFGAFLLGS